MYNKSGGPEAAKQSKLEKAAVSSKGKQKRGSANSTKPTHQAKPMKNLTNSTEF